MKFLIIQTAFLGDVILATSVAEKLHQHYPDGEIDFLLQKGNEVLLKEHPFIKEVIVLGKKKNKISNLFSVTQKIRKKKYDCVINLHRFGSSGFITFFSGAKQKIGFDKNPFSFCYTQKAKHEIGNGKHEIERNHALIKELTDEHPAKPKLYPSPDNFTTVQSLITHHSQLTTHKYICIAPASVWFTKQFPKEKWIELIQHIEKDKIIFLLGAPSDFDFCEHIKSREIGTSLCSASNIKHQIVFNLAGKLSLLETAALMRDAEMNFVNDSAPLHIASAMNAVVTAVFCSTIPAFGFSPLSDKSKIIETRETLDCRPCGLHGYTSCPKGHFKCAYSIDIKDILTDSV